MTETRVLRVRLNRNNWLYLDQERQRRSKMGSLAISADTYVGQALEVFLAIEKARQEWRAQHPEPGADEDVLTGALVLKQLVEWKEDYLRSLEVREAALKEQIEALTPVAARGLAAVRKGESATCERPREGAAVVRLSTRPGKGRRPTRRRRCSATTRLKVVR